MNLKEYLKQISIVIFGILIAFWLSNMGVNYKERAAQKQVLHTILNELNDNNAQIVTTLHSLDTLYTTYYDIQNKQTSSGTVTINYLSLQFKSIGYETAKYTGILKDLNYKLTSKIVENYESQSSLVGTEQLVIDELLVLIRNKTGKADALDYILLQILNLKNQLERFDKEQKLLIEDLTRQL